MTRGRRLGDGMRLDVGGPTGRSGVRGVSCASKVSRDRRGRSLRGTKVAKSRRVSPGRSSPRGSSSPLGGSCYPRRTPSPPARPAGAAPHSRRPPPGPAQLPPPPCALRPPVRRRLPSLLPLRRWRARWHRVRDRRAEDLARERGRARDAGGSQLRRPAARRLPPARSAAGDSPSSSSSSSSSPRGGQGFLARPAPSGPRLDTPPRLHSGDSGSSSWPRRARVIFRELGATVRRGRAAGRRGLLSPPALRVAASFRGLAPPPGGSPENTPIAASPVLGRRAQRPPRGRLAQVRALRSPIHSAAVPAAPDRLLGSAVPPDCCCIPSGRPAAAAASVAPAAQGSAAAASPHQRARSRASRAPAPPGPEQPTRAAALRPSRSRQLCSRSVRGGGGEGAAGCPDPDSQRRASEGRGPRAAHRPLGECLGRSDSPPLPPPLPPPAPSPAARAAP